MILIPAYIHGNSETTHKRFVLLQISLQAPVLVDATAEEAKKGEIVHLALSSYAMFVYYFHFWSRSHFKS